MLVNVKTTTTVSSSPPLPYTKAVLGMQNGEETERGISELGNLFRTLSAANQETEAANLTGTQPD